MMPTGRSEPSAYTREHRALEIAAILAFVALAGYLATRLVVAERSSERWLVAGAALAGYVAADFLSGVAHWLFDTWGSIDTPVIGRSFIRPFRDHHRDAGEITRHDFVETNGNNCIAAAPVLAAACFIPVETNPGLFATAFVLSLGLAVFATNQFHKWAHVAEAGPVVRRLQRWHLILPVDHHLVHHRAPYETHYCITTGWLNPILRAIDFYPRLERLVTSVTGAVPRRDEVAESLAARK